MMAPFTLEALLYLITVLEARTTPTISILAGHTSMQAPHSRQV